MAAIGDFTIRERNVLTLPQAVRDASGLASGAQGKAVAVQEGVVLLVADPALARDLASHVTTWLDERRTADPWARLNAALAADQLEPPPTERLVAAPELAVPPSMDRVVAQYGDDPALPPADRPWRE